MLVGHNASQGRRRVPAAGTLCAERQADKAGILPAGTASADP